MYGPTHEFGAVIKSKGRLMRFKLAGGEWRSARRVKIPARPYLAPALADVTDDLEPLLIRILIAEAGL